MSSMSASDAAPLPRLGEVYFDVRGESRSMRLSWYADTGVAVFSIWQGGTCTGTFRLPITDLPRMIETLQRGPHADTGEAGDPHDAGQAPGQHSPGDHGASNYGTGSYGRTQRYDVPGRDLGPEPETGYYEPGLPAAAASKPDDPLHGGYGDEPHDGPYRADSLPGGYRADLRGGYHDDPLSAGYADESRGGGYRADRHGDYPDDPLTGAYPDERHASGYSDHRSGYADDHRGGYVEEPRTARYRAEPPTGDYPTGPSDSAIDDLDYLAPGGNAGYSPARPYVAPLPDSPPGTGEGRGGRRRSDEWEESDPSPDSFPYRRPPG